MAEKWFCQINGEVVGPITPATLKQFAQAGLLAADGLVTKGRDGKWVVARTVRGLFDRPPVVQPPPAPPIPESHTPAIEPASTLPPPPQPVAAGQAPNYTCPKCGNRHFEKVSVANTWGVHWLEDNEVTRRLKNPQKADRGLLAFPLGFVAFLLFLLSIASQEFSPGAFMFSLVFAGAAAFAVYSAIQYNETVYKPAKALWERSYFCKRCSSVFEIEPKPPLR